MEFKVDKANSTVHVKREFNAPQSDVWSAWTEAEILDQWWAPKPYQSKTKSMEFKEGGRHLYAMVGPNGEEHWALADYTSITPKSNFKALDAFCDEHGNIDQSMNRSDWNVDFIESDGATTVDVLIRFKTLADLEKHIEMGFKEGFTATLEELSRLLEKKNK